MVKDMTIEMIDEAPYLWLPTQYLYTAWWPWVKNYGGELRAGAVRPWPIYARMWIDQDLKKELASSHPRSGSHPFFGEIVEGKGILSPVSGPLLRVEDLSVSFRTDRGVVQALDSVSLEVDAGETLAIVGESGSGKSVTALSILRLIPEPPGDIEGGRVLFDGQDLLTLDTTGIRDIRGDRIAIIFQEPMSSLNPVLTIGKQVAEPIRLHRRLPWREALKRAATLLERVAIPDARSRLTSYPHEFSGGMRQRVMIAMALACEPRLIIADEPTTALDVTVQAQILALLKELTLQSSSALILITHDLGVVARYADRVAVMYGGRIVETAPAHELYRDPRHPYTRGLMASIPRLDDEDDHRLVPIEGQPPDLANLPVGCAFAPDAGMQSIAVCTTSHGSRRSAQRTPRPASSMTDVAASGSPRPLLSVEGLKCTFRSPRGCCCKRKWARSRRSTASRSSCRAERPSAWSARAAAASRRRRSRSFACSR